MKLCTDHFRLAAPDFFDLTVDGADLSIELIDC